jgi:hypothetical protein
MQFLNTNFTYYVKSNSKKILYPQILEPLN